MLAPSHGLMELKANTFSGMAESQIMQKVSKIALLSI